jgi:hypothetical protein
MFCGTEMNALGVLVAGLKGGIGNVGSLCQTVHRVPEAKLLSPFAESHTGFFLEESLYGGLACTDDPAYLCESTLVGTAPDAGDCMGLLLARRNEIREFLREGWIQI